MHESGGINIKKSECPAPVAAEMCLMTTKESAPIVENSGLRVSIVAFRSMETNLYAKGADGRAQTKAETSDEPDSIS